MFLKLRRFLGLKIPRNEMTYDEVVAERIRLHKKLAELTLGVPLSETKRKVDNLIDFKKHQTR